MVRTERKKNDDSNDIFSTFDEEFEEMRARMDKMMEGMMTGLSGLGDESSAYGVSMRVGPDGKPRIQEFGNFDQAAPSGDRGIPSRELLMDVIEEKDRVRVIVELPGVQKSDINLSADDRTLDIAVDTENKKFSRRIDLPCAIKHDSTSASYKNGVLEITMDRTPPKRRKKKTIVQ
jgi:HSP20 family protein